MEMASMVEHKAQHTPGPVAEAISNALRDGRVMVTDWRGRPRHLRVRKDDGGYYVRTGKRGTSKEYIRSYRRLSDSLCEFSTKDIEANNDHGQFEAWQTSMGMRGYAGSPAEREGRAYIAEAAGR